MKGRMRPYLPELTIRDYNTYMRYLRGVRRQMYKSYGFYACHLLRTNGVLFAILSDSLAGRMPTCKRQRVPGTLFRRSMMCQTLGIRQAAQTEILMGWHNLQDRKYSELRPAKRVRRAVDKLLLRRAYDKARQENPALERLFAQEREQAVVQMNLSAKNYALAAEPMSNVYGALYSTLALRMTPTSARVCGTSAAASAASSICWTRPSALKPTAAMASTTCSWSMSSTDRLPP